MGIRASPHANLHQVDLRIKFSKVTFRESFISGKTLMEIGVGTVIKGSHTAQSAASAYLRFMLLISLNRIGGAIKPYTAYKNIFIDSPVLSIRFFVTRLVLIPLNGR